MSAPTASTSSSPDLKSSAGENLERYQSGRADELRSAGLPQLFDDGPGKSEKSKKEPMIREISCHTTLIIAGWADGGLGPLIPYMQSYYHISYEVVSIIFFGQMAGCFLAASLNSYLTQRFGLGRVVLFCTLVQLTGYALIVPGLSFPTIVTGYGIAAFAMAMNDAQCNAYIATLPGFEHKFAYLHASYGLGAVVCPLAATAFVSQGIRWSYFFGMSCGLAILNGFVLLYAFRASYRIDDTAHATEVPLDRLDQEPDRQRAQVDQELGAAPAEHAIAVGKKGRMRETTSNRTVLAFAMFITIYVGTEVGCGGWIVTFIQQNRHGGPSAGYIATGFWLGILLGRATLSYLNVRVGERKVVFYYLAFAVGMEFVIWFARNVVADGVAVALVGYVMGPSYPIVMSLSAKTLPRRLHTTAIGFMSAIGTIGGALIPFVIGALSQRYSPAALQPAIIVLLVCQAIAWFFVPNVDKKEA